MTATSTGDGSAQQPVIRGRGQGEMFEAVTVLERPPLQAATTAVVVVDMVNWQVPRTPSVDGDVDFTYFVRKLADETIPNLRRLIAACRSAGARIVYLRVGCYADDYSDALPAFRQVFRAAGARAGSLSCAVIDELRPQDGDLSLVKTGSGGFTTSGLDGHLRNLGIEHVLYTGVITNGCVLLTLAAGFDLGYYGYLVSDSTATYSEGLQESAESLVSGWPAELVTTDSIIETLRTAARRAAS
jgi:nicotinamidase-related amidase